MTIERPVLSLDDVRAHAHLIHEVVKRYGASNPRVFGSVARGEARAGSDVDLLVDDRPALSLLGLVRLKNELWELLGAPVDVVVDSEVPTQSRVKILGEAVGL